jgi:hypothetical protein
MKGLVLYDLDFLLFKNAKAHGEKEDKDQGEYSSNDPVELYSSHGHRTLNISLFLIGSNGPVALAYRPRSRPRAGQASPFLSGERDAFLPVGRG